MNVIWLLIVILFIVIPFAYIAFPVYQHNQYVVYDYDSFAFSVRYATRRTLSAYIESNNSTIISSGFDEAQAIAYIESRINSISSPPISFDYSIDDIVFNMGDGSTNITLCYILTLYGVKTIHKDETCISQQAKLHITWITSRIFHAELYYKNNLGSTTLLHAEPIYNIASVSITNRGSRIFIEGEVVEETEPAYFMLQGYISVPIKVTPP